MTGLTSWAANQPNRCALGFAIQHHPQWCACDEMGEWSVFLGALRNAARNGEVHQKDVRPLIRGRIAPKHIGQLYARAKREGLLEQIGKEPSSDTAGRNTHHDSPIYELRSAA